MLLWMPSGSTSNAGGMRSPPPSGNSVLMDEDEKAAKIIRRQNSRFWNLIFLITSIGLVILVLALIPNTPTASMRGSLALPANSIYRASVEDDAGTLRSLSEYAGKVALVVNTACK